MQSSPSVGDVDEDVSEDFVLDEELCSLHEESIHGEDDDEMEMAEIDALSNGAHSAHSFTSGSALGTGAFLPVGKAHVTSMAGLEEWVAEAAEQKMMPVRLLLKFLLPDFLLSFCSHVVHLCWEQVPQGKQRLDDLLSESEHYPSKNPEEIQIHPDMIGNNIWNRMKALEKLVELQRNAALADAGGPVAPPLQPRLSGLGAEIPVHSMSVKDIEREILSLSDTYPPTSRAGGMTGGGMLPPGAEASTLQRQMSGGAVLPLAAAGAVAAVCCLGRAALPEAAPELEPEPEPGTSLETAPAAKRQVHTHASTGPRAVMGLF
jgi:hypothetical protein